MRRRTSRGLAGAAAAERAAGGGAGRRAAALLHRGVWNVMALKEGCYKFEAVCRFL